MITPLRADARHPEEPIDHLRVATRNGGLLVVGSSLYSLAPGAGAGSRRVNLTFRMTADVLLFQLTCPSTVFVQGLRCAMQERFVPSAMEVRELADQVGFREVLRASD